ncbi:MAG: PHP domain-containing protein [Christensenellaceae bacterium]|jgi:predicted metal-dependent phosphoesterase TrpH|nr:PHP domain-containing protein [Christensenellaceae bacterium]
MIDLHTHTNHSDGRQTVAELLQKAEKQGLKYLSITDHNSVGAYIELQEHPEIRKLFSGEIINGTELEFEHGEVCNELLGYFIDIYKIKKVKYLDKEYKLKIGFKSFEKMYNLYRGLGFRLSNFEEMTEKFHKAGHFAIPIIAEIDSEKNIDIARKLGCKSELEFRKWRLENVVSTQGKYYVEKPKSPSMKEVSQVIRDAGGKVFMAHIWRIGEKQAMPLLDYAVKNGLIDGIEVYYQDQSTGFTDEQIEILKEYAQKHNLLISGGSDSHKLNVPLSTLSLEQVNFFMGE